MWRSLASGWSINWEKQMKDLEGGRSINWEKLMVYPEVDTLSDKQLLAYCDAHPDLLVNITDGNN